MPPVVTPAGRVLRIVGHLCRLALAWVFLFAGAIKALDPDGFAAEVGQYGIVTGTLASGLAYILIPVEVALGAALLLNFRPTIALAASTLLMAIFIGAIGYALATDRPLQGCGCFGRAVVRTPQQTLVEDLVFLAAGVVGLAALRGAGEGRRWKAAAVGVVALASGAFVAASPSLPLDDVATELKPGVLWADLGVALAEADLTQGRHIVVLLGMRDEASAAAIEPLNELAASGRFPMIGLHGEDEAAYNEFFWSRGPAFPIYALASSDMKRLHRRLPRLFAVADGTVTATWGAIPPAGELEEALR